MLPNFYQTEAPTAVAAITNTIDVPHAPNAISLDGSSGTQDLSVVAQLRLSNDVGAANHSQITRYFNEINQFYLDREKRKWVEYRMKGGRDIVKQTIDRGSLLGVDSSELKKQLSLDPASFHNQNPTLAKLQIDNISSRAGFVTHVLQQSAQILNKLASNQ
jgi:hypothetical protein